MAKAFTETRHLCSLILYAGQGSHKPLCHEKARSQQSTSSPMLLLLAKERSDAQPKSKFFSTLGVRPMKTAVQPSIVSFSCLKSQVLFLFSGHTNRNQVPPNALVCASFKRSFRFLPFPLLLNASAPAAFAALRCLGDSAHLHFAQRSRYAATPERLVCTLSGCPA